MLRKAKKPTTSVTVVTKGLDATAGSNFRRYKAERDQDAAERGGDQVADHRQPDDDGRGPAP